MGHIKEKLIEEMLNKPVLVGEMVRVDSKYVISANTDKICKVIEILDDNRVRVTYKSDEVRKANSIVSDIVPISAIKRDFDFVGVNPIPDRCWHDDMIKCNYNLSWVLTSLKSQYKDNKGNEIATFNFNPYLIDKEGNKVYYQRDFCWSLKDKKDFIESIYNQMNCGVIVIKYNDDDKMCKVGAEYDVIDGKQRLKTLIEFFNDEFEDKNGYYWSDFSKVAQRRFLCFSPFTVYEFRENVTDERIKEAFLNVNHMGVEMSKEHIQFVKSINL